MIQGTVTDIGVPIITIPIAGKEWPATIDTGFNGDLELPEALRNVLKPQYVGRVTLTSKLLLTLEEVSTDPIEPPKTTLSTNQCTLKLLAQLRILKRLL